MSASYVFADEWPIAASRDDAVGLLRRVEDWPSWWPSVRSVVPLAAYGLEPSWRFTFRTRLPYAMIFDAQLVSDDESGSATRITGRVEGSGFWRASAVPGGTMIRFDWRVRPTLSWMRVLSPIARPLFAWNHRVLMSEGARALAARLGTELLGPAVSRLLDDRHEA